MYASADLYRLFQEHCLRVDLLLLLLYDTIQMRVHHQTITITNTPTT